MEEAQPVAQQPKKGRELSIGSGGQVQLDAVEKKQPNADRELSIGKGENVQLNVAEGKPEVQEGAPKVRGEGDGIEFDPATGEYVRFDKFYMSAPEEWAERYRIRTGQEPSEAQMQAIYSLGIPRLAGPASDRKWQSSRKNEIPAGERAGSL